MTTEPGVPFWRREWKPPSIARQDVAGASILALLIVFVFHECILFGRVLYKWDIHLFWYSSAEGFVRTIAAGALPLWNPNVAFGRPMLADANYQVFYPATWLHLLMGPRAVHLSLLVAHCLWTGAGLFLLARRLGCSRIAAWTAAAMWLTSGPLLSLVYVWNHFTAACWIPWGLLAADRVRARGSRLDCILWGASLALPVMAGSPDVALYLALATAAYVLCAGTWRHPRHWDRRHLAPLVRTLIASGVAVGLSACQWMPSLALTSKSNRGAMSAEIRTSWSAHPWMLAQTLEPVFPTTVALRPEHRQSLFQSQEPFLDSLYLGLAGLGLVVAALVVPSGYVVRLAAVMVVAFVAIALGHHTPAYELASHVILPLRLLRYPEKAMIMVAFFWALLAGLGMDAWARGDWARWRRWTVVTALGVATLAALAGASWYWLAPDALGRMLLVAGAPASALQGPAVRLAWAGLAAVVVSVVLWRKPRGSSSALFIAALVVADLAVANRVANPAGPQEILTTASPLAGGALGDGPIRVYVYDYLVPGKSELYLKRADPYRVVRVPAGWSADEARALSMRLMLFPPSAQVWGLDGSYDMDVLELYPPWLSGLMAFLRAEEGSATHLRLLRMAGVSHVVALHQDGLQDLALQATIPSIFPEPLRILRVPEPLPRCYAVSGARIAVGQGALAVLRDPAFVPEREVLLPEGMARAPDPAFSGVARLVESRPDRVRIEAELDRPGVVVLLDGYDEGWRATIDGHDTTVLRANVAFRAVAVGAGKHLIELVYRPAAAKTGVLFSAATCILAGAWVAGRWGSRRRRSRAPSPN